MSSCYSTIDYLMKTNKICQLHSNEIVNLTNQIQLM